MTSVFNDVVKQGYVKLKSKKVGVWQKKWVVLKKPSSKGPLRLEKYSEEKSAWISYQNTTNKMIDLTHTSDVYLLPSDIRKNTVAIIKKDGSSKQMLCDSESEATDWMACLREECCLNKGSKKTHTDKFNVYLLPAQNLGNYGECVLHLTATHLNLYDAVMPGKLIASWPYTSLRKYGGDSSKFTFESGRMCDTGEGLFVLNTPEGCKIHEKVQINSIAIAESYRLAHREELRDNHTPVDRTMSSPAAYTAITPQSRVSGHSNSLPSNARAPQPLPRENGAVSADLVQSPYEKPVPVRPRLPTEAEYTLPSPPPPPPLRTPDRPTPPAESNADDNSQLSQDFMNFLSKRHDST